MPRIFGMLIAGFRYDVLDEIMSEFIQKEQRILV